MRDPNPGPGPAKLVDDALFAPNRALNPGAGVARLAEDPLFARKREPNPGLGVARLVEDPLLAPNRERMLKSDAWGRRGALAWLCGRVELVVAKSNMLAAARLWVSRLAYGPVPLRVSWGVPDRGMDLMLPLTTPFLLVFCPKNWPSPRAFWSMRFHCCA